MGLVPRTVRVSSIILVLTLLAFAWAVVWFFSQSSYGKCDKLLGEWTDTQGRPANESGDPMLIALAEHDYRVMQKTAGCP